MVAVLEQAIEATDDGIVLTVAYDGRAEVSADQRPVVLLDDGCRGIAAVVEHRIGSEGIVWVVGCCAGNHAGIEPGDDNVVGCLCRQGHCCKQAEKQGCSDYPMFHIRFVYCIV